MITGRNQRRAHAASPSAELGSAGERSASAPTSRTLGRTTRVAHAPWFSTLERLPAYLRERELRAVADAVAQERRRIAADVHDLVMQDLSFALSSARAIAEGPDSTSQARSIAAAAERALAGAREMIGGLIDSDREPIAEVIEASVRKAARHVPLSFHAEGVTAEAQPDQPTMDALVHIGREAVTNAIKHSTPAAIEVVLEHEDEWRLQVRDDGGGFDVGGFDGGGRRAAGGFGLQSMKRHAQALGGSLRVRSIAGAGTAVEAILP